MALTVGIIIFINLKRNNAVVRAASLTYCNVILVGSLLAYASVFMFMERPTTAKCVLQPLLICLAFVLMYWYSSLFSFLFLIPLSLPLTILFLNH